MRRLAAELLGTFTLVFAGTGDIVINDVSGGTVSHVGVIGAGVGVLACRCVQELDCCRVAPTQK